MRLSLSARCRIAVLAVAVLAGSSAAIGAPGDPAGPLVNVAQGGVLNHDPFFQDFNTARGMIELAGGNLVVGWRARENTSAPVPVPDSPDGANGKGYGSFFKVLDGNGVAVSGVIGPYYDLNSDGTGRQNTPLLAALSGGGFVMVWNSAQGPGDTPAADPFGGDAYGRVYSASGTAVSATFKINENDPSGTEDTQEPVAVVGLTGGGFAVVWVDGNDNTGNTDDYFLRVYSATGVPQAGSVRLGGAALDPFFEDFDSFGGTGGLIALSNGNLAVAWGARDQNNDGTGTSADGGGGAGFFQVFNASGAAVNASPVAPYLDINPDGSGSQDPPALAALSGGGFVATWNSNHNTNDGGNSDIGIGFNGTNGGDTYARVYNGSGVAVSGTVRVNDLRTDDVEEPAAVVGLAGGGFAIVWKEDDTNTAGANNNTDDYYVRAYSAAGAALGPSVLIGGPAADPLFNDFSVAKGLVALSDGGFAVGIRVRDSNNDGSGTSIDGGGYAAAVRVFNADGSARTGVLFPYLDINADGSGSQNIPLLATVSGGFAVTWNSASNTNDGANSDVGTGGNSTSGGDTWTRLYNNAGAPVHATTRVHDTEPTGTADEQTPASIVKLGANYAVLIKDNNNNTGNKDDYFVRVFGDTPSTAPEIVVEQPAGTNIADGGNRAFGSVNLGSNASLVFTIRNTGTANLTGLAITKDGAQAADFTVTATPTAPVAPAGSTTFTVQFTPAAAGTRNAAIHIASNDADENPFDINLSGTGIALPILTINDVTVTEGNTGTVNANFTVSLNTPALAGGVSFDIATQNGSAVAPGDYTARVLTGQTIAAGSSTYAFTVQVNGDFVDEANESFLVNVTNVTGATIGDGQGAGNITDDDTAGISVTPTSGLGTAEAGGTDTFSVVLNSQPTSSVSIGLSSSDPGEGSVSSGSLTFSTANWNTPQTVTVTGVDDFIVDGNIAYSIVTAAATSADGNYNGLNAADVAAVNSDDDVAGIIVSPLSGLVTTEGGGSDSFTVVLRSQPAADVSIALSSSDPTEGNVAPTNLTFTAGNWNVPQTVSVTGVDDVFIDGNVAYSIITAPATSGDSNYNGLNAADVAATNNDNDVASALVVPVAGLVTTEAGGTATFSITLTSQPSADVTIGLSSSDPSEGNLVPAGMTFTAANWNVPQTATVTGADDLIDDGDIAYSIVTAPASSGDSNYNGFNAADVGVTNIDDDAAGVTVTPTSGLTTTEAGGSANFSVVLTSQPTADVSVGLSSSDATEGSVSPPTLTFTAANWNIPQTATVTGVDDDVDDGDIAYSIVTAPAVSADSVYSGINAADVGVTNIDDDAAGITVTPTSGLTTTEAGGSANFSVVLTSQPTADVSVGLSSSDATEGSVSPLTLTFTAANWDVPQTATVTGVDDFIIDGSVGYSVMTAAAVSADSLYNGMDASDVGVTNTDNDVAGFVVAPNSGLVTTEAGGSDSFTVVLTSQPSSDVTVGVSSSDATEGSTASTSLTFNAANWNVPQAVSVSGVDDVSLDGDVAYSVVLAPAVSADTDYQGVSAGNVGVTNVDDETDQLTSPTATGSGIATILIAGGQCSLDLAQSGFITIAGLQFPTDASFPHGAVQLRAQGCDPGTNLTVTLTFPTRPSQWALYKLSSSAAPFIVTATATGSTSVTYSIVDGGPLDADGVQNGVIVDPVALGDRGNPLVAAALPAGDVRTWFLLALLLVAVAYRSRRSIRQD